MEAVKVALKLLPPLRYNPAIVNLMLELYQQYFPNLVFEPQHFRYTNPRTRCEEDYYSHPVSSVWYRKMYEWARSRYAGERFRLLLANLYCDGTLADDGQHHPVYLTLGNGTLMFQESMEGKRVIAMLPYVRPTEHISDPVLARLRALVFQRAVGIITKPFVDAHLRV